MSSSHHILMNESVRAIRSSLSSFFMRNCLFTRNRKKKSLSTAHRFSFAFLLDNFYLCGEHFVWILCTSNVNSAVSLFTDALGE